MKRYLSAVLAATVLVGLTAFGGGAQQASSASDTPTPSPTRSSRATPDVAGMNFLTARTTVLRDYAVDVVGKDGKKCSASYPDKTVTIDSSSPASGTVTDSPGTDKCLTKIDGQYADAKPAVLPSEQTIVDIVAANAGTSAAHRPRPSTRFSDCAPNPMLVSPTKSLRSRNGRWPGPKRPLPSARTPRMLPCSRTS